MTEPRPYKFSFYVGAIGAIVLLFIAIVGPTLTTLSVLAAWIPTFVFVVPWLYLIAHDGLGHVPGWIIRGPHQ